MATVYDMCAVTEVIYCDIKNINGQYSVVKKCIDKNILTCLTWFLDCYLLYKKTSFIKSSI
jgi:hypothetical protein